MVKPHKLGKNERMSFSKIPEILEMPDLLEVQKKSYQWFLTEGLKEVLSDVSPIEDDDSKKHGDDEKTFKLEFVDYRFEDVPRHTIEECKERNLNYATKLYVTVRFFDYGQLKDKENKKSSSTAASEPEFIEKEIYIGDFPKMTDNGTFVINGAERVIISQICRSPGVYYGMDFDKTSKKLFNATVIPYRGAWLEYETDTNDVHWDKIDKTHKLQNTILIRALGIVYNHEIRTYFGEDPLIVNTLASDPCEERAKKNPYYIRFICDKQSEKIKEEAKECICDRFEIINEKEKTTQNGPAEYTVESRFLNIKKAISDVINDCSGVPDDVNNFIYNRIQKKGIENTISWSVNGDFAKDEDLAKIGSVDKSTIIKSITQWLAKERLDKSVGGAAVWLLNGDFVKDDTINKLGSDAVNILKNLQLSVNHLIDKRTKMYGVRNTITWLYEGNFTREHAENIGFDAEEVKYVFDHKDECYYEFEKIRRTELTSALSEIKGILGVTIDHNGPDFEAFKEIFSRLRPGEPFTEDSVDHVKELINNMFFDARRYDLGYVGRYKYNKKLGIRDRIVGLKLAEDVVSAITGEVYEAGAEITEEIADALDASDVIGTGAIHPVKVYAKDDDTIQIVFGNKTIDTVKVFGVSLEDCGIKEKCRFEPLKEILEKYYADLDAAKADGFAAAKEEIAFRIAELVPKHITKDDIFSSINYIICLSHGIGNTDDIDHLGNRRLRCVGELLQNQIRIGFTRMDKAIREKIKGLPSSEKDKEKDKDKKDKNQPKEDDTNEKTSKKSVPTEYVIESIVNPRPIVAAIREFFGSSPLSQFMDQNNPLAELTHKRRLSALGPGGISRDRASFDVRDVHYTHYGRICPIETPEGQNIGLISYLATYSRINKYGFIEAPYFRIDKEKGVVTTEAVYMTADQEDKFITVQANEPLDENRKFVNKKVIARRKGEVIEVENNVPDFMDVSPKMVVSVATAHIPFLENDDNSRALMGSNMQKQAVPLLINESPIVGTGMEYKAAHDSGIMILAKNSGFVEHVSADKIVIATDAGRKDTYHLQKFKRSNQSTCINQRPIVNVGDRIEADDVIADGPATSNGEISLGKNALIGFMTWEGYNYEDAVLLNENLVREDKYTSIHIEEYSHEARETKLGAEEITNQIPNVSPEAIKNLDEEGVVRIGTEVRPGDILVGKVSPKGETELTPEMKLLYSILNDKAKEVRDTSLRVPHGAGGIVVDVKVFSRTKDSDMATGVLKDVRVYVAQKRKISVGDKMAGRHGNKGVVSRILPPEDMPFMADGTPLDIVLNPMGVPSRMNIGQVLEVHLGIAAKRLGYKVMTPVFDGAKEQDISELFKNPKAGMYRDVLPGEVDHLGDKPIFIEKEENGEKVYVPADELKPIFHKDEKKNLIPDEGNAERYEKIFPLIENHTLKVIDGKTILYDGRTGERFDNPVTVGIMYYLKLHHLVDDKIHARSTGPYSLVTQQPLGGKAQFGGQRFGEMEVWALEAYGAAYTLQEILTIKSDDIEGRVAAYNAIIEGKNVPTPGAPEAFRVLVRELRALCLDIKVLDKEGNEVNLSLVDDVKTDGAVNESDIGEVVNDAEDQEGYNIQNDDEGFETDDIYSGYEDDEDEDY